jgi:hypothetical protein
MTRFVGVTGYGSDSLREDFARFRFLLGSTDGEGLFSSAEARRRGERNKGTQTNQTGQQALLPAELPDHGPVINGSAYCTCLFVAERDGGLDVEGTG